MLESRVRSRILSYNSAWLGLVELDSLDGLVEHTGPVTRGAEASFTGGIRTLAAGTTPGGVARLLAPKCPCFYLVTLYS